MKMSVDDPSIDPVFGAAVLKLSFLMKGIADQPGFRVVYFGTIRDLGITDAEVNAYIEEHRSSLENYISKTIAGSGVTRE